MTTLDSRSRGRAQTETMLQDRMQTVLAQENWAAFKPMIKKLAGELGLNLLECASALAYLVVNDEAYGLPAPLPAVPALRMVRYRLEVGRKHQVTEESIKKLLIEESGVESRRIGRVYIHSDHTLIHLPDGMPGELYRHLKSVEFNRQPLRIKRLDGPPRGNVKSGRNQQRRRHPLHSQKNQAPCQATQEVKAQQTD